MNTVIFVVEFNGVPFAASFCKETAEYIASMERAEVKSDEERRGLIISENHPDFDSSYGILIHEVPVFNK